MRTTASSGSKSKGRAPARPGGESPTTKVNRSQVQAMEARSAATPAEIVGHPVRPAAAATPARTSASTASRRTVQARPVVLTREQEYAFIREDMRRLIIIASGLLVLMIVLLFILG